MMGLIRRSVKDVTDHPSTGCPSVVAREKNFFLFLRSHHGGAVGLELLRKWVALFPGHGQSLIQGPLQLDCQQASTGRLAYGVHKKKSHTPCSHQPGNSPIPPIQPPSLAQNTQCS
ncbi:hypothetical protein CIRG_05138 [Coccidioides immitis RMSCC 2394]|uniref:Uncharacterized protein n=1 Tax=Coccidioides immitis RMSCC 2394 TaxID=404692 RepID=A0A0J7B691_COCIT|nr:hypothetical protein CIRG_05138 [Coccidioides immitis RMSCC 2394]